MHINVYIPQAQVTLAANTLHLFWFQMPPQSHSTEQLCFVINSPCCFFLFMPTSSLSPLSFHTPTQRLCRIHSVSSTVQMHTLHIFPACCILYIWKTVLYILSQDKESCMIWQERPRKIDEALIRPSASSSRALSNSFDKNYEWQKQILRLDISILQRQLMPLALKVII